MKKLFVVMMISLLLCGCGSNKTDIESNDYKEIMKANNYIIVDVRKSDEYDELHVRGAINIPVDEISEDVDLDKEKDIFVYCKSGKRSKNAYNQLKKLGFKVYDLGSISEIDLEKVSTDDMKVKKIIDKSLDIKDFTCAQELEKFYSDEENDYYFSCLKGDYIVVVYNNEEEQKVEDALKEGTITIKELDKFKIKYYKEKKIS